MIKQEAIKLIEVAKGIMEWDFSLEFQIAFDMAIEALKNSNAEWINIRERLPEDGTRVFTTIRPKDITKERRVRTGVYKNGLFMNDNGDRWKSTDKELVAWMPLLLPEPYRGNR